MAKHAQHEFSPLLRLQPGKKEAMEQYRELVEALSHPENPTRVRGVCMLAAQEPNSSVTAAQHISDRCAYLLAAACHTRRGLGEAPAGSLGPASGAQGGSAVLRAGQRLPGWSLAPAELRPHQHEDISTPAPHAITAATPVRPTAPEQSSCCAAAGSGAGRDTAEESR